MIPSNPASTTTLAPGDEHRFDKWIALLALIALAGHLIARFSGHADDSLGPFTLTEWPLILALAGGGLPLVAELSWITVASRVRL